MADTRDEKIERLAEELAQMTGESAATAMLRALEERKERVTMKRRVKRTLPEVLDFLEREVWAQMPRELQGRRLTKEERERILGYGRGGV